MARFPFFLPLLYGGVAVALLATEASAAQTSADAADGFFAKGVKLHQAGDILGAIEAYQDALVKDPNRLDARSNLGAALVRLGRYDDAVREYGKALDQDPDNARIRFNLGLALYKAARASEAAEELKKVVDKDAQNKSARLVLADCLLQLGQDAAVVSLLSGRDAEFGDDRLYAYLLGNALVRRSEVQAGQVYIDRLFRDGDTAEARLLMGAAQLRRQDFRAALEELQRAVELNPALASVQSLYGRALMATGRRDDATAAFRKELESSPNDFDANLYLGLLLKDEGALDESLDRLRRADRLRPNDARVLYGLGALHVAAGRTEEAQRTLEALVKLVPDYTQGHVLLATVYFRQKNKELGEKERAIVEKLRAEGQAREPGASDELGPAYRGEVLPGGEPLPPPKKPGKTP
jgi:tetratricopeptide (TPR) repeat protein